jgi:hypothetical protein
MIQECPSCGSAHLPPNPCGLSFGERLRTVRIDPKTLVTRSRKRYYDEEALNQEWGTTARQRKEQLENDTQGLGVAKPGPDGHLYRKDRKSGDVVRVTQKELNEVYLGGDTEV